MSKTIQLLLSLVLFICLGCNDCWRVSCVNGGECSQGQCLCEDGVERPLCVKDTCFQKAPCKHGNCEYGWCVCDENWAGQSCDSLIYVDHEGSYFGGFICNNYQVLSTISVDKTGDKKVFEFYEEDYRMSYDGTFVDAYHFIVNYQRARIYNNVETYVEGNGYFEDNVLYLNMTYYNPGQAEECTFDGEKTGI